MKENVFTTIENQIRTDGSKGVLYDHYTDKNQAYAKFYTILAAAAVSELPYHEALLFDCDGTVMERKAFDRRVEVEPAE